MRERKRKKIIFQLSSSTTRRDQSFILFLLFFSLFLFFSLLPLFRELFLRYSPSACLFFFDISRLPRYPDWTTFLLLVVPRYSVLLFIDVHRFLSACVLFLSFSLVDLHCVRPSNMMTCIKLIAKILNDFLPSRDASTFP